MVKIGIMVNFVGKWYVFCVILATQISIMKKIFLILLSVVLLTSCSNKKSKKLLISSSGRMNHALVVINNDDWQGRVGDSIRKFLARDMVGLPQAEPVLHLNQIDPRNFSDFLRANRNIIFIKQGDKNTFVSRKNVYAKPQYVAEIKGKTKDDIIKITKKHAEEIIKEIQKGDMAVFQKMHLSKNYYKPENVVFFKENGVEMRVPYLYQKSHDDKEYVWFVRDIPEGYLNILVYTLPITSPEDENGENIIKARDEKGHYIPGDKEGMHILTEKNFTPEKIETKLANLKTYETRGNWYMTDDFMAGPFVNYTLVDKKNNRLIVAEGLVYAPNIKKRNYMFELESIIKTLKLKK